MQMKFHGTAAHWKWALLCIFIFYFICAVWANTDLTDGRFALFMDERITFDGVKRILHPTGIKDFLFAVGSGGDHRYGRILWYSMAAFSYIPERLFGDSGQIVAGRMWQVLLILASCSIWIFGIVRSQSLRVLLALVLLSIPYSSYYMTMPKPEPLQMLFLSLFCYFFFHKKGALGWHWIFVGLAFGAKIATLPAVIVFAAAVFLLSMKRTETAPHGNPVLAVGAFFLGQAIAVPILIPTFFLALISIKIYSTVTSKYCLKWHWRSLLTLVLAGITLLFTKKFLLMYVSSTFLGTTHGADQVSINGLSWIHFLVEKWLIAPTAVSIFFIFVLIAYCFYNIFLLVKGRLDKESFLALTIVIAGVALNVSIFIGAKRLWGFYLYPGTFITMAGIVLLADCNIQKIYSESKENIQQMNIFTNKFVSLCLLFFSTFYWLPYTVNNFYKLSQVTQDKSYISYYDSYKTYVKFLEDYSTENGKSLQVAFTPSFFPPQNTEQYKIVEFWGSYVQWNATPDVIIFGKNHTLRGTEIPKDSPSYKNFIIEREGYARHVTEQGGTCGASPCFERVMLLPNEGEILVLQK